MATILLTFADEARRAFLERQLMADGHVAVCAGDHAEAVFCTQADEIAALLVDVALHDLGGLRLIREVRAAEHCDVAADAPIAAFLGSGDGELELLRAYEAGADDVLHHDASYVEVRCRLASLLRRATSTCGAARRRRVGQLEVDLAARTASIGDRPVELSNLEFELLAALSGEPKRVFTKRELLREVWGMPDGVTTRTLDSHACRLRRKLAEAGGAGYVSNRWGYGYALMCAGG